MDLLAFKFLSEPVETEVVLAMIYNLMLTMCYFALCYCGYRVIVRNLRKGKL